MAPPGFARLASLTPELEKANTRDILSFKLGRTTKKEKRYLGLPIIHIHIISSRKMSFDLLSLFYLGRDIIIQFEM